MSRPPGTREQKLCRAIENAFAGVVYPGDENIAMTGPHEDYLSAKELVDAFGGKHWKEILHKRNAWLRSHYWALTHFTPRAFHFYLPAFLIKCVSDAAALDLVPLWIVCAFAPPAPRQPRSLRRLHRETIAQFNVKQRKTLIRWFGFLREQFCDDCGFVEGVDQAVRVLRSGHRR